MLHVYVMYHISFPDSSTNYGKEHSIFKDSPGLYRGKLLSVRMKYKESCKIFCIQIEVF